MKYNSIVITAILVLIVGALSFFGGMKYQQTKGRGANLIGQFTEGGNRQSGARFGGGAVNGANRPVLGQIINLDDKSITVKMIDGSSKIVLIPDTAVISKTDTGAKTDLKTGINVGVFGTTNSDGSVTAQNIQLNPLFRMGAQDGLGNRPRGSSQSGQKNNPN